MPEEAYARTPVGEVEVKELPARVAYEAHGESDVFVERNDLFSRNFRFLKENRISMTTPVELDVERPAMRFFVPEAWEDEAWDPIAGVEVRHLDERLVVSVGGRGGYSKKRFEEGAQRARTWLAAHPEYEPTGPAEIAYWDGPMRPPFMRRFEVHVPVREVQRIDAPLA